MRTLLLSLLLSVLPLHAQLKNGTLVNGELKNAPLSVSSSDIVPEVAWWKFNDGSGTSAADATGNGNTGTLSGNTTWGTGPNSNGDTVYDGTGDLVTMANEANFDFATNNAFSITFWVKANSSASGTDLVLAKTSTTGNQPGYLVTCDLDNQVMRFTLLGTGGDVIQAVSSGTAIVVNTWYFVACTCDGSSAGAGLKIYINAGSASSGSGGLTTQILNNEPLILGVRAGLGGDLFGELDDTRVYNRVLTAGEISTLNSGGAK